MVFVIPLKRKEDKEDKFGTFKSADEVFSVKART